MNNIKIFTDSTCDLSTEILEKYDISVVPLYVSFGNETYKDGIDINTKKLYDLVDKYGILPKTSAPSPTDFYEAFKPYIDEGKDIIYIGLSSKISSTLQNAKIAASKFPDNRIEIIDSLNLSTGIGLLVLKAVDYAKEGLGIKEIGDKLRNKIPLVKTSFVIDTLDYLYKGGRCSALQSFVGSMLKIKPIVKVVNGTMILGQKARGKRRKIIDKMLENTIKESNNIDLERIIVTHSMGYEDALYLKNELENNLNVKEVIITDAGCVISSHCGPNTVGILYINKE
ncbi:DegV family protein [Caloranaerobacter ferrireducens]|uniref:DegV family protein n=1 Tax=Caloranaerobacter ferrireducens TaxID=1323370 RepID=UPI00084D17AC|nr:DegV family protein [Caloranaerobacter ferrireducens]